MNTTFMEAISITISSMTIVLMTLALIALILGSFKHIFKEKPKADVKNEVAITQVSDDEEEKLVACLAAAAMAGDGKINPNLHIKRVTRIR